MLKVNGEFVERRWFYGNSVNNTFCKLARRLMIGSCRTSCTALVFLLNHIVAIFVNIAILLCFRGLREWRNVHNWQYCVRSCLILAIMSLQWVGSVIVFFFLPLKVVNSWKNLFNSSAAKRRFCDQNKNAFSLSRSVLEQTLWTYRKYVSLNFHERFYHSLDSLLFFSDSIDYRTWEQQRKHHKYLARLWLSLANLRAYFESWNCTVSCFIFCED